ncbi:MAG: di/tricarboxylate transporter [Verrucomicrobiales bacterium]|jgi:di/tricarboxylate transporter
MGAVFVLLLFVLALVLFVSEKVSVDVVTLILLAALMLTGILTPTEAFSGFASEVVIILASISVIAGALQRAGVLEFVVSLLVRMAAHGPRPLAGALMGSAACLSAFMNNTTVTALLLPAADGAGRRSGVSSSKLMMPLAFGSILGGTCTLIGTSTNVAVSGYLGKTGLEPIGLFELTPIGLIIAGVGIAYMLTVGIRLLPDGGSEPMVTPDDAMRDYLCEIEVLPNSPLIGENTVDCELQLIGFRIMQVVRGDQHLAPGPEVVIGAGDTLLVEGKVSDLTRVQKMEGIRVGGAEFELSDLARRRNFFISEVLVAPGSDVVGKTLAESDFRQRFGLTVLAVNRFGEQFLDRLAKHRLSAGDVLLVEGPREDIELLQSRETALVALGVREPQVVVGGWKGWALLGCFLVSIVAHTVFAVPLSAAFLTTAVLAVLSGCVTPERARESIDLRLLILIGGMTGFGLAMEKSGAAQLLADWVTAGIGPLGPFAVMTAFFVLTIILTQPMSNAAAALVVLPIAISAATAIGADPRSFSVAIMLAASISFITPFEPSCLLVYGPGRYRFRDFFLVGGGLTLALTCVVLPLIPVFWPLK